MEATTTTTTTSKNGRPEGWDCWLTAGEVSRRLRCARTHVYRLEQRGELVSFDGVANGKRVRKFDPASVAALAPTDDEIEEDQADDIEATDSRVIVRVLADSRAAAIDARKGQQEAYQLVAGPSRELHAVALATIKQQAERIRELETQLNKMHDESRDARRDDREFAAVEKELADSAARKDKALQMLLAAAPELFAQVLSSVKGGPLAEWMKKKTPADQKKLIGAIEAVMSVDDEMRGESPAAPEATQ